MKIIAQKQGMTLIEMLVVISIISIVVTIAVFTFTRTTETQKDETRLLALKNIQVALESYYNANGKYPSVPVSSAVLTGEGKNCRPVSSIQHLLQPYLDTLPVDPEADNSNPQHEMHYKYSVNNNTDPQQYILAANVNKNNYNSDNPVLEETLYQSDVTRESALFCKCTQQTAAYDIRIGSEEYQRLCVGSLQQTSTDLPKTAFHFPANYQVPTTPFVIPPLSTPDSTPSDPQVALAVGNLQAFGSADSSTLTISWNAVSTAIRYELRYKESTTNIYTNFSGTAEPTGTTLTDLNGGTTYNIQVRAIGQEPGRWATTTATTQTAPTTGDDPQPPPETPEPGTITLAQVTGLSLTASTSSIKASWTEIAGVQEYEVQRCAGDSTACATGSWVTASGASVREGSNIVRTLSGFTPGTQHTIRVRAKAGTQTGPYSATQTATIKLESVTGVVVAVRADDTKLRVSWSTSIYATGYDVEYRLASSAPSGSWNSETSTTSPLELSGLSGNTEYQIRVRGTKGTITGDYSDVKTKSTLRPITVTLTPSYTSVAVSWTAVEGATEYDIEYRKGTTGSWSSASSTSSPATISSLDPSTAYSLRMRVKVGTNAGRYTTPTSTTTLTQTQLGSVTTTTSYILPVWDYNNGSVSYTASWNSVSNATSYVLEFCITTSYDAYHTVPPVGCIGFASTPSLIERVTTTSTTYTKTVSGGYVRIRVKAISSDSQFSDSPWSTVCIVQDGTLGQPPQGWETGRTGCS